MTPHCYSNGQAADAFSGLFCCQLERAQFWCRSLVHVLPSNILALSGFSVSCMLLLASSYSAFVSCRKQWQNQDSGQAPHNSDSLWIGGSEGGRDVCAVSRNDLWQLPGDLLDDEVFSYPGLL